MEGGRARKVRARLGSARSGYWLIIRAPSPLPLPAVTLSLRAQRGPQAQRPRLSRPMLERCDSRQHRRSGVNGRKCGTAGNAVADAAPHRAVALRAFPGRGMLEVASEDFAARKKRMEAS